MTPGARFSPDRRVSACWRARPPRTNRSARRGVSTSPWRGPFRLWRAPLHQKWSENRCGRRDRDTRWRNFRRRPPSQRGWLSCPQCRDRRDQHPLRWRWRDRIPIFRYLQEAPRQCVRQRPAAAPMNRALPRNYRLHRSAGARLRTLPVVNAPSSGIGNPHRPGSPRCRWSSRGSGRVWAPDRQLLACSISFNSIALLLVRHCTAPVLEWRLNKRSDRPAKVLAVTVSMVSPPSSSKLTLVPAVTNKPASMVQRSPRGIPKPAFAPIKHSLPTEITISPPPERVPIVEQPPPRSEPSPTQTPAEMRPSIIPGPSVPALKLMKPSCMTVVPSPR